MKKNFKFIIVGLCLIIFCTFATLLVLKRVSGFDDTIYKYVIYYKSDKLTAINKVITFFCSTGFIIGAAILGIIISKERRNRVCIPVNVGLCCLLNQSLKFIFARNRPVDINLITETGYSFPSGHSMVSMAFYGLLIYIIFKKNYPLAKKLLLGIPLMILILLVGLSRIYLGVHFASDVVAGFALSLAYLILFITFVYNSKKMQSK